MNADYRATIGLIAKSSLQRVCEILE